jgi:hypothetical protein
MLLGIGVCAGCLLVLAFIPLVHRRATRITTRHMDDATPLAINAIQADKDRLRAEFATSVRRLEVGVEEMRTKAAGHLGEIGRQKMEIQRLRLELDKKMALVFALRYRDKVRKSIVRRLAKLVFYAFIRSERRTRRELFGMVQARSLAHARRAHFGRQSDLKATAPARNAAGRRRATTAGVFIVPPHGGGLTEDASNLIQQILRT